MTKAAQHVKASIAKRLDAGARRATIIFEPDAAEAMRQAIEAGCALSMSDAANKAMLAWAGNTHKNKSTIKQGA